MAVTHGMNPDEVERLGRELQQIAGQIQATINRLNGRIGETTWLGPDANRFKSEWWPGHRSRLQDIQRDLNGFGQSALNNATEQRNTSGR